MFVWLMHFLERHPHLHRISLSAWRYLPPRLAAFLRQHLNANWAVGAVAVMIDADVHPPDVVIVQQSYHAKHSWRLPGGLLEPRPGDHLSLARGDPKDNVLESTLRREIFEELGIEIEIISLFRIVAMPYVREEPGPYRLTFYYNCRPRQGFHSFRKGINSGTIRPRSPEVVMMALIPVTHLDEHDVYPSDARLVLDCIQNIGNPCGSLRGV